MRKIHLMISILGLLILACSSTDLIPAVPTPVLTLPLPTETLSIVSTPTQAITPTQPTPTLTSLPTIIETTPTLTGTPATATTVQATSTPQTQITVTPEGPVFDKVTSSGNQLIWGQFCPANSITFTAHAVSGFDITSVLLFTRLQSKTTGVTTRWSNGISMHTDGAGTFTYALSVKGIPYYQDFQSAAWIQYQLVATNSMNQIVERTQIDLNSITLARCP